MIFEMNHEQKPNFLVVFTYFGYLVALYGSLEGPKGAPACKFSLSHILLLIGLQTIPAPRFFTNLLKNSEEYKVNSHKFGFFSMMPHTPKRGVY